jgi:hypothetical protein
MAECRAEGLPSPLPWIEPSINMLYLECVLSYLMGNEFSSIINMSVLLEHVLRLAVLDRKNTGLTRSLSLSQLEGERVGTISKVIERAVAERLIDPCDRPWWEKVAKVIRNKTAHFIIPRLIKEFTRIQYTDDNKDRDKYAPPYYRLAGEDGQPQNAMCHDWGMFFHKVGFFIARAYIVDGTEHLKRIIARTEWKPDRSWWANQELQYNSFFQYSWDVEDMKQSLSGMCVYLDDADP